MRAASKIHPDVEHAFFFLLRQELELQQAANNLKIELEQQPGYSSQ